MQSMKRDEKLIYENDRRESIELSVGSAFFLENIVGLDGISNSITSTKVNNQDGEIFLKDSLDKRNIEIEGTILRDIDNNKSKMISIFNPKLGGKLLYKNRNIEVFICCRVENAPKFSRDKLPKYLISLYCPNPYFLSKFEVGEEISTWIGGLKFKFSLPFRLKQKGEPKVNVYNDGHVETPVEIIFKGPAQNPSIVNHSTKEFIKVKRTLSSNDTLYINTEFGNKTVEIDRNGTRENAFNYIDLDSTFFNLQVGDNLIEYTTENDLDPQSVEIKYRNRYLGV